MKKLLYITTVISALLITSCTDFARDIQKTGEFPLALGFEFIQPDFGPGDTVTLRTYWTGGDKPTDPSKLNWEVSWEFYWDNYGNPVVLNRQSLAPYIVGGIVEQPSESETQIFDIRIAIPEDIILNHRGIPDDWTHILANLSEQADIPDSITVGEYTFPTPTTKAEVLKLLDFVAAMTPEEQAQIPQDFGYYLNGLSQFHTAGFRIYCDNSASGGFETRVTYSARYHERMKDVPGVFENSAPQVAGAKIYQVAGDHDRFDPINGRYDKVYEVTSGAVTIPYNSSNSYFFVADLVQRDSVITTNEAFGSQQASFEEFTSNESYDEDGYNSVGFISQTATDLQEQGIPKMVRRMNFGEDDKIVKNKPLLMRMLMKDVKMGTSYRPEAVSYYEFNLTIE